MGKNTCPQLENLFVKNHKDLTKNFHQFFFGDYLYSRFLSLKRLLMKTCSQLNKVISDILLQCFKSVIEVIYNKMRLLMQITGKFFASYESSNMCPTMRTNE